MFDKFECYSAIREIDWNIESSSYKFEIIDFGKLPMREGCCLDFTERLTRRGHYIIELGEPFRRAHQG